MLLFHRKSHVHFSDPLLLLRLWRVKLHTLWIRMTYPLAGIGKGVVIDHSVELYRHMAHRIRFGQFVEVAKDAWFNVAGPLEGKGEPSIIIDDGCLIARRCQISAKNYIHLERDVILSPGVAIVDHTHANDDIALPIAEQGVTPGGRIQIGRGCWIGHGAAILCDSGELVLGRNCVVAANSVVTRSCPPYSVIAGNPARVVKQFDLITGQWRLGATGGNTAPTAPFGSLDTAFVNGRRNSPDADMLSERSSRG